MSQRSRLYLSPPHMAGRELEYVQQVFEENWIAPAGPQLPRFEQAFARRIGVEHAVALASGTAALHLALKHLGVGPEDEVICPTFTFCASANAIVYQGASPVFLDSEKVSWNLDPNLLEEELTDGAALGKLPRAIVVVDVLGQSADMAAIGEIAERYEVPVVEDAAEALGATYQGNSVGSQSSVSIFSFNGNKIITCGGGGMLCTNDSATAEHARYLSTQARDPVPHYFHREIGYNYRLSNVLAAIGLGQLENLSRYVAARKQIFERYQAALAGVPGVSMMPVAGHGEPSYWLTCIEIDEQAFGRSREETRRALEKENIETRPVWCPMHQQPVFANMRNRLSGTADRVFAGGLCLPSGSAMTEEDVRRVVEAIERVR